MTNTKKTDNTKKKTKETKEKLDIKEEVESTFYKIIYYIIIAVLYFYAIRFLALTGYYPLYGSLYLPFQKKKDGKRYLVGNIQLKPQQVTKLGINITSITDYLQENGWTSKYGLINLLIRLGFNIIYIFYGIVLTLLSGVYQSIATPLRLIGSIVLGGLGWIFGLVGASSWSSKLFKLKLELVEYKWLLFGFHRKIYDYVYELIKKGWKYPLFELGIFLCYGLINKIFGHLLTGNLQNIFLYGMLAYIIYIFSPNFIYNIQLNQPNLQEIITLDATLNGITYSKK